jgi:hypothetical protein
MPGWQQIGDEVKSSPIKGFRLGKNFSSTFHSHRLGGAIGGDGGISGGALVKGDKGIDDRRKMSAPETPGTDNGNHHLCFIQAAHFHTVFDDLAVSCQLKTIRPSGYRYPLKIDIGTKPAIEFQFAQTIVDPVFSRVEKSRKPKLTGFLNLYTYGPAMSTYDIWGLQQLHLLGVIPRAETD